jgi:type IV pilus assembly protein PilA
LFTDPSRTSRILQPRLTRTPTRRWERSRDESGFGFVEILVVILIIGVLAAIALPAFLNQKTKAYDAAAKELVHSAAITAETIATDNNGQYTKVTAAELNKYEPTIQIAAGGGNAYVSTLTPPEANGYSVTATAASTGDEFTISKSSTTGAMTRTCTSPKGKTDCSGSTTSSW